MTGSGGICTFCGAKVALTYGEHSQEAHAAKAQPSSTAGTKDMPESIGDQQASSSEGAEAGAEKTAEAIAFKNRLVSSRVPAPDPAGFCSSRRAKRTQAFPTFVALQAFELPVWLQHTSASPVAPCRAGAPALLCCASSYLAEGAAAAQARPDKPGRCA